MKIKVNKDLKMKILSSKFLFKIAVFVENIRFIFHNKTSVSGKENTIYKAKNSIFRDLKIYINGNGNRIFIGERCRLKNVIIEISGNNNNIIISEKVNFMVAGKFLIEGNNCCISIGERTLFRNANLFAGETGTRIEIGNNCFCGVVNFSTSDFHSIIDTESGVRINPPDNIFIGNNNWITNNVNIRKGTVVLDNSVIGANSVLNKKFLKSNVIIVGQPAKIIRENIEWSREKLPYEDGV